MRRIFLYLPVKLPSDTYALSWYKSINYPKVSNSTYCTPDSVKLWTFISQAISSHLRRLNTRFASTRYVLFVNNDFIFYKMFLEWKFLSACSNLNFQCIIERQRVFLLGLEMLYQCLYIANEHSNLNLQNLRFKLSFWFLISLCLQDPKIL